MHKRVFWLLIIHTTCFSTFFSALSASEKIWPNPSFEEWDTECNLPGSNWRFRNQQLGVESFAIFQQSTAESYADKYSLHLKDVSVENNVSGVGYSLPEAQQYAGMLLDFSVWVKQIQASRVNTVGVVVVALTKSQAQYGEKFIPTTDPTDWEKVQVKMQLPADLNGLSIYLMCANHYKTTAEAYFDHVALTFTRPQINEQLEIDELTTISALTDIEYQKIFDKIVNFPQDLPFPWQHEYWGGLKTISGQINHYQIDKQIASLSAGIRFRALRPDRLLDLSEFAPEQVELSILLNQDCAFFANIYSCDQDKLGAFGFTQGIPEADSFRYNCTLADFKVQTSPADFSQLFLHFTSALEPGILELRECKLILPEAAKLGKSTLYANFLATAGAGDNVYYADNWTRPTIKNSTFFIGDQPQFYLGPIAATHSLTRDFSPQANPLNIDSIAYLKKPDADIFSRYGFNTFHLSDIVHDMFFTCNFREEREFSHSFSAGLPGVPAVMDMSIGRHPLQDPLREQRLQQQNPDWHAYIPMCPEHPEVQKYYERRCQTESDEALAAGYNVFAYELVNESSYNCFCDFNRAAFAKAMQEKYGTLEKLNQTWGTDLQNFAGIAYLPCRSMPTVWPDWCKFAATRYVDFLLSLKNNIRRVDQRPNVYFTEQLAIQNVYTVRGAAMDYRLIADALDIISHEGGLRFGNSAVRQTGNVMEDAACAENRAYMFISDFYDAIATPRGKVVMNDEYYCARFDFGKRVPSRRLDMVSAMWFELFHGSSGALLYHWDKRFWEYKTFAQAKNNVIDGGYKAYSYLNPYNWPPDQLDFGQQFFTELAPYKDKILIQPRKKAATVALLYCYPALRMEGFGKYSFKKKMLGWHEALLLAQYPLQIVFAEELETLAPEFSALIMPEASYVTDTIPQAVQRFIERGGLVIADQSAMHKNEYGQPLAAVSDQIVYFDAADPDSAQQLVDALDTAKILRHGALFEEQKPLRNVDLQMIDRGDFKMIFLLNMSDIYHRQPRLQLYLSDSQDYYLSNIITKEIILPTIGQTWNAVSLAQGLSIILPPQERLIFTLEREKPAGFTEITAAELQQRWEEKQIIDNALRQQHVATEEQINFARQDARNVSQVQADLCYSVDISNVTNMAFADSVAGDQIGGWFDQGSSHDYVEMPIGDIVAAGVKFHIIDPNDNQDKAAIILTGRERPYFPDAVTGINIDAQINKLYFLHTVGWGDKPDVVVLIYRMHYADNTQLDIPVRMKQEINSWGDIEALPKAKIALEYIGATRKHLQCLVWTNPQPEKKIVSLDIISAKTGAVPAIVAITAERL